jgi:two-component system, LytTR family, sensor kinase
VGVTAALQQAGVYAVRGELQGEWLLVLWQIPRWLMWAAFTPLIFAACRRFPLARVHLHGSLLVHLGLAALVTVVAEGTHAQMSIAVEKITGAAVEPNRPPNLGLTALSILTRLVLDLVTYAAVVGVALALDAQRRLRERDARAARLEADLARAQVQAIKMQVQPHFLFNTLHAINVLIGEDPAVASRMVTHLGDLLRHTLSRATVAEVPLRAELDVLALYLAIERVRFQDRLTVVFDVPPETMSALVPELVLKPLAENAITHGIGSSTGGVVVRVRASRAGEVLTLEVTDTGAGPGDGATPRERVGLSTVRARLERLYGAGQSLTVERASGGGCVSRITLPFLEAPAVA